MTRGRLEAIFWILAALLLCFLAVLLTACPAPRDQVVLLEITDPGGQITVTTPQATQTLSHRVPDRRPLTHVGRSSPARPPQGCAVPLWSRAGTAARGRPGVDIAL